MSVRLSKDELKALLELNLKHCQPMCKEEHFNKDFLEHLIMAQKMAGFQFVITSGFRSKDWEVLKGRDGSSSHCRYDKDGNAASLAADISTPDSFTRFKVVFAAGLAGIPRIGIGKNFVHLDTDLKKAHPIIFHYYE